MEDIVKRVRNSFKTNETKSVKWRREQLLALERLVTENHDELCKSLRLDLNKPEQETIGMELGIITNSITHALKNLDSLVQLKRTTPIVQARAIYSTYVQYQPYGARNLF